MTKRDRQTAVSLIAWIDEELGTVDFMPTIRFFNRAKRMLMRQLVQDDKRRLRAGLS